MQIIVNSHVFSFDLSPTGQEIKNQLHLVDNIPIELISLTLNGLSLSNEETVEESDCILRATIANGLCGGKGGFGANLRSLAKQKGKTKTTDFGACRDLSGRRLRHINDEIILSKWKEAKDKGEQFDTEEETATGIDLWYLSAPSWAEGIKVDKRKKFMKPRMKTELCIDWLRARETKDAPNGAPIHWGCPRGARCEFAHGENELKGESLIAMKESKAQIKNDELTRKRDDYLNVVSRAAKDDEEVGELVLAGLRAAKRTKMTETRKTTDVSETTQKLPISAVEIAQSVVGEATSDKSSPAIEVSDINLLCSRSTSEVSVDTAQFTATGLLAFGTVCAPHCVATEGAWCYEVELQSDGLMQIGWVSNSFTPRAAVEGDGVGDDAHSWAFDGYRQKAWHGGVDREYGPQTGVIWRAGDVVGCFLNLNCANARGSISYSLNGVQFGPAFELQLGESDSSFSPAMSLESEERATLNLGQEAFAFPQKVAAVDSSGLGDSCGDSVEYRAVWLSIDPAILQLNGFSDQVSVEEKAEGEGVAQPSVDHVSCIGDEPECVSIANDINFVASVAGETAAVAPIGVSVKSAAPPPIIAPESVVVYEDVDLNSSQLQSLDALIALGMGQLRHELEKRGLKTGGTAAERASRLMAVRGLKSGEMVDKKLLAKVK